MQNKCLRHSIGGEGDRSKEEFTEVERRVLAWCVECSLYTPS